MIELEELREEIGYHFDYVENEGGHAMRFDIGNASMWIHANGTAEGFDGLPRKIRKEILPVLTQNNIKIGE